jgi:hypothetical protein
MSSLLKTLTPLVSTRRSRQSLIAAALVGLVVCLVTDDIA